MKLNVGMALKKVREARGFSQMDLASDIAVKQQTVATWETGDRMMRFDNFVSICRALDVSPSAFVKLCTTQSGNAEEKGTNPEEKTS